MELVTRLVVDVGDHADAWRDAAIDAERAFLWWRSAAANERRDAAAAYLAAIDREETAAFQYSKAWEACCATVPGCRLTTTDRRAPGRNRQPRRPVYDSQ